MTYADDVNRRTRERLDKFRTNCTRNGCPRCESRNVMTAPTGTVTDCFECAWPEPDSR